MLAGFMHGGAGGTQIKAKRLGPVALFHPGSDLKAWLAGMGMPTGLYDSMISGDLANKAGCGQSEGLGMIKNLLRRSYPPGSACWPNTGVAHIPFGDVAESSLQRAIAGGKGPQASR